jgi:hypothetical protein
MEQYYTDAAMKKITIPLLLLLLAACSPIRTVTPNPAVTDTPANGAPPPVSTEPSGAVPAPTIHTSIPPQPVSPLFLRVLTPLDQQVVNTPQVEVIGEAPQGAVITVNDEILVVGADQKFSVTIPLVDGPNLVEIVASDSLGSEMTLELVVIYEP